MAARLVSPQGTGLRDRACMPLKAMCLALTLLVAKPVIAADSPASDPTGRVWMAFRLLTHLASLRRGGCGVTPTPQLRVSGKIWG